MIQPWLMNDEFLEVSTGDERDDLHLWWLGQNGFLVQWQGAHLLMDPYLSDSLTKIAATDKPHVRMTKRVIAPRGLHLSTWSHPATTTPITWTGRRSHRC